MSSRCGVLCLGLLTFHPRAKGAMVHLSEGGLLAQRKDETSVNALLFSSRPIRKQERVRLRVLKHASKWNGALRLGFTNVPPDTRRLPLPSVAIPDLNSTPGHWVGAVCESLCRAGSDLEFWVSHGGNVYVSAGNYTHLLLSGLDLSRPLWAVIDLYGQTQALFLLGSTKKVRLVTRRSCSVRECIIPIPVETRDRCNSLDTPVTPPPIPDNVLRCVVCMEEEASATLPCGHRCLCFNCKSEFLQRFNTCPLCRRNIHCQLSWKDPPKS